MLREIRIKNLAIVEDVGLQFEEGLNILTGETGAGKSIIISALCLALGERASSELVRSGEKEAVIEAFFDIPHKLLNHPTPDRLHDMGINIEEGIILKRIISAQGKSRAYINDSMVNVQTLSEISGGVIDIHGQYEHQSLLMPDNQLALIDVYGGLLAERQEISELHESQTALKQRINRLVERDKEMAQRLDILEFQINEIGAADLRINEAEKLSEEEKILGSAVRLAELANQAYETLYSSETACIADISKIQDALKEISGIDSRADDAVKSVEEALPLLEETAYFLRDYKDGLDFDPHRLQEVQERLELIKRLTGKYGDNVQKVLDYREKALKELDGLQHSEEKLEALKKELGKVREKITEKAQLLSKKRKAVSKKIEKQITKALSGLSMPDTKFSIQIIHEAGDDTTDLPAACLSGRQGQAGGFKVN